MNTLITKTIEMDGSKFDVIYDLDPANFHFQAYYNGGRQVMNSETLSDIKHFVSNMDKTYYQVFTYYKDNKFAHRISFKNQMAIAYGDLDLSKNAFTDAYKEQGCKCLDLDSKIIFTVLSPDFDFGTLEYVAN